MNLSVLHRFPIHSWCFQGDYVWVDSSTGVPIGARVKVLDGKQVHLLDDEGTVRILHWWSQYLSVHKLRNISTRHLKWCSVTEGSKLFCCLHRQGRVWSRDHWTERIISVSSTVFSQTISFQAKTSVSKNTFLSFLQCILV